MNPYLMFSKAGDKLSPLGLEFDTAGGRQMLQCWNTIGILRLIQSIPSKRAAPFLISLETGLLNQGRSLIFI